MVKRAFKKSLKNAIVIELVIKIAKLIEIGKEVAEKELQIEEQEGNLIS
jgi:hypothetical protein